MYNNSAVKRWAEGLVYGIRSRLGYTQDEDFAHTASKRRVSFVAELTASTEKTPLLGTTTNFVFTFTLYIVYVVLSRSHLVLVKCMYLLLTLMLMWLFC